MRLLKAVIPAWAALAAYAAFLLWARSVLPDAPMAVHFDVHMHADRFAPRDQALFLPLLAVAVILAILTAAPFLSRSKGVLERSAKVYGAICFAFAACISAGLSGVAFQALHWPVSFPQLLAVSLGLMVAVLGNYLTKVRRNNIYGVRTPWTLANEAVWDKTHRLAGPFMMAGGLFVLVGGLLWPEFVPPLVFVGVLVPALFSVVYSWWLWTRLPPDERRRMRAGA